MAQGCSPDADIKEEAMRDFRKMIESLYPEWKGEAYCVPPLYFNRVPYEHDSVAGKDVRVLSEPVTSSQSQPSTGKVHESDMRDDFAQQHVLLCLQKLGKELGEAMFIISQYNYADYLNKPSYAKAIPYLPKPKKVNPTHDRGDFDVLIIHLKHGIIIGEIKSVGLSEAARGKFDDTVAKRIEKALKQLKKSEEFMNDIAPGVSVKKTVILPYVTSTELRRVLQNGDPSFAKKVLDCLGATNVEDAVELCLCADQLSSRERPDDVTPDTMSALKQWFKKRVKEDPNMSRDTYLDLLAKIVGPASTVSVHCVKTPRVEVRTLSQAVSELGERLTDFVLTPEQLDLLHHSKDLPRLCLHGPPGTGKSLVLVLAGLDWLRAGHDVLVVAADNEALGVSKMIVQQLETTLKQEPSSPPSVGKVLFLYLKLHEKGADEDAAVQSITDTQARHIIMDEADFADEEVGPLLLKIIPQLLSRVPDLHLWAATLSRDNIPKDLEQRQLTVPLRNSPNIVREVEPGLEKRKIITYKSGVPFPSDGPEVIELRHERDGDHHDNGQWPVDCYKCGQEVAEKLHVKLHVGDAGKSTNGNSSTGEPTTTSPPPLRYSDVFVLTRSSELQDDVKDESGNVKSPASAFVCGLRESGIPACVVKEEYPADQWETLVTDLALAKSDHVTVAHYSAVSGLERKVVVLLRGRYEGYDDESSSEDLEKDDSVLAVSRCTSQLIKVVVPK